MLERYSSSTMRKCLLLIYFVNSAVCVSIQRVEEKPTIAVDVNFTDNVDSSPDTFEDNDIYSINKRANMLEHLYQGDIKLNSFRNAQGRKWPKGSDGLVTIPVTTSFYFTSLQNATINSSFDAFHKHTCVRFTNRTTEMKYVQIISGFGCWSEVGYINEGRQLLSLGTIFGNCVTRGITTHEFMHVLGFLHEHSRSDRDNYLKLIEENVYDVNDVNFQKENTTNLVIYDYGSIMHYYKFALAKQRFLPSFRILPRQNPEPEIGQREQISAYDIEEIKYYYNCEPGSYERCGRDFTNHTTGTFQTPSYPRPYPSEEHCTWNITVRSGRYVEVTFLRFLLEDSTLCQADAVIIHDGPSAGSPVLRKTCGSQEGFTVTSTSNSLFVIFTSNKNESFRGFQASFEEVTTKGTPAPIVPLETAVPNITDFFKNCQCDFDANFCGLTQDSTDNVDFKLHRGATGNPNTGPTSDHTSTRGQYIYLDSSEAKIGYSAIIRSPWFRSGSKICVKFSYHMWGQLMGGLRLYAYEKIRSREIGNNSFLWEKLRDQGNGWHTERFTYTPASNVEYLQFYWDAIAYMETTDIAMDDIEITPGDCNLVTVYKSRSCDFENGLCGFVQLHQDQFDWTRRSGTTPSRLTGPSGDHTTGTGHYMYIETSPPRRENEIARLESPNLTFETHCVRMWYHMNGNNIKELTVYKEINDTKYVVRKIRGNRGELWRQLQVEINTNIPKRKSSNRRVDSLPEQDSWKDLQDTGYANETEEEPLRAATWMKVVIEATVGDGSRGDIAIDDIEITGEKCGPRPISTLNRFSCNFETNLCGLIQSNDDQFNWIRNRGTTRTRGTGPSVDNTQNNNSGFYIYIEASVPRQTNDVAKFATPELQPGSYCLQFAHHMYGSGVGRLRVLTLEGSVGEPILQWMNQGNQGDQWHQTSIEYSSVDSEQSLQFFFEGVVGSSSAGDIALDDIIITSGNCSFIVTTTMTTPKLTTITSPSIRTPPSGPELWSGMPFCTFENKPSRDNQQRAGVVRLAETPRDLGSYIFPAATRNDEMCGWYNFAQYDNFNWVRYRGSTPSSRTGPSGDKTTGRGYYLYIESSAPRNPNDRAFLQTYSMPAIDYCVDMNYHMYGINTGRLSLRTVQRFQNGTRRRPILHEIRSDQGNRWNNAKIDFVSAAYVETVAFRLEGVIGSGSKGDIAVDDIAILPGRCDICNRPTHRSSSPSQVFAAGCVHTQLFYVRCCNSSQPKAVYRRVRNCNYNMFTPTQLRNFCRN